MNAPMPLAVTTTEVSPPQYEVAVSAAAAAAKATVSARYEMALRKPRDWDNVRTSIIRECRRPSFAHDKSAWYKKPIGQGVEGLGIRFAEMALRCMGNVLIEQEVRYEDDLKEVIRVTVTDLEANITWPGDVPVRKTVERSKAEEDGTYFSVRTNSYGKPVYTVRATDDDLLNKRAALVSKAVRTLALRIIPGDIQNEAEETIKAVRMDRAAQDPDAERKRVADAFAELHVTPTQLATYLGHPLDQCSPAQLVDLRALYGAIRDGEATWKQVMDNKAERERENDPSAPPPPAAAPKGPPSKSKAEPPAPPPSDAQEGSAIAVSPAAAGVAAGAQASLVGDDQQQKGGEFMATGGEKQNIIARARARQTNLADLLAKIPGAEGVNAVTLDGLTKEQFKLLRADLA